jgi:alkanesulfonate monooxygenase SsuD/methylene tetrahydromethanopterin reductase-like flavin-dependent oxidoreductase (luciferase family)
MDVGIGLPATIPGVARDDLLEWARRADSAGFSSLGVLDRLVYPNYESLISLAAAGAVTERIRLMTDIMIVPYRINAALLAKQALTVHGISAGRLVLGLAVGSRPDDYEASGVPLEERGRRFDEMLAEIDAIFAGEERGFAGPIGPPPPDGPPEVLIGGSVDAAFRRAARFGAGWTVGGSGADTLAPSLEKLRAAWDEAGREGEPRVVALAYFALGEGARERADSYLHHYYAIAGDEVANMIAEGTATDEESVHSRVEDFAAAGTDELILFPCSNDPGQVDLLAGAVL